MKKFHATIGVIFTLIVLLIIQPVGAQPSLSGPRTPVPPLNRPPMPLHPLKEDVVDNRRPAFEWTSAAETDYYQIQISRSANFLQQVSFAFSKSKTFTPANDLPANTQLYWRVRGQSANGWTRWSIALSFFSPNPPSIPRLISPANGAFIPPGQASFHWNTSALPKNSPTFSMYEIQVAQDGRFSSIVVDKTTSQGNIHDSKFTLALGLLPDQEYYWRVRAYNMQGDYSSWSDVWNFHTDALPPTSTPTATLTSTSTPLSCTTYTGIGIMGDSNSDEYRADDARGSQYAATTLNWMEQLVRSRSLNFGRWGVWGEPRRTGYEYNWARSGATARTLITTGQHTGLAKQVSSGKVSVVVLWIGSNDFHLKNGPYAEIYNGTLSGAALEAKLNGIVTDISLAMDTVLAAGRVDLAIVTIGDPGLSIEAPVYFPDPLKRQRVTDAVHSVNARIREAAVARGALVVDSDAVYTEVFANVDAKGYLNFGGKMIYTLAKGDDPYHLQLADNIGHAGTVLSGIFANSMLIDPFSRDPNLCIPPLSDLEILRNAGIP